MGRLKSGEHDDLQCPLSDGTKGPKRGGGVWVRSRNKTSQSSLLLMVGMTLGARYVRIILVLVAMP